MEDGLNSLNAMRMKEIIDINTGSKKGFIKDIKIDCETNKIIAIIVSGEIKGWFSKCEDIEIPWSSIVKIGSDVLLVNYKNVDIDSL